MAKIVGNQDKVGKGIAKVSARDRVFETKSHDLNKLRCVKLNDTKGTKVYLKLSDTRTDYEVREAFKNRLEW